MAVRRLASDDVQPQSFAFSPETEIWAEKQIAKYPEGRQMSAVIPLLWRVQHDCGGWIPQKALEAVAVRLDMPYIRVLEVATFYTMFNLEPVGRHFVQLCGTTPCALRGANELKKVLERRIGDQRHVTDDGLFSWLEVECLGACCNAPMVQINDDYYEDLTPEIFDKLLDDLAAGRPVKVGPQQGRTSSEPAGDVKTLQDPSLFDGSVVGAWRQRFAEAAVQDAPSDAAAAAPATHDNIKAAKPDAGRATESPAADAPAQRAAAGETPVSDSDRAGAGDAGKSTVASQNTTPAEPPPPQSDKSYVANPVDPAKGRTVADAPADEKRQGGEAPDGKTPSKS
jgi:NADH-quinone oxidoreductase subunit E